MTYVLQTLHKNVQRLQSLAFCALQAPKSRPTTAEKIAESYRNLLQRKVPVSPEYVDRVVKYMSERALIRKYDQPTLLKLRQMLENGGQIEVQDWFLSDPSLPSATGAEREQSYVRTVAVCEELRLIRDKTLLIHTYGELLNEIAQLRGIVPPEPQATRNPFQPDAVFSLAAYYQVLQGDFEFQRQLLMRIPVEGEISFSDLCNHADDILNAVGRAIPPSVSNRSTRKWLEKRVVAAEKLSKRRTAMKGASSDEEASIQTLYRPFEDLFLPRLEFLVDIKALVKPTPTAYKYCAGPAYAALSKLTGGAPTALDESYFHGMAAARGRACRVVTLDESIAHLRGAYQRLKNLAGYAPIIECVMYANAQSWETDPCSILEFARANDFLHELARTDPPRVRINTDRFRRPFTFRIED